MQDCYNDRRIAFKDIGGRYPDELAFNLASALTNTYNSTKRKVMYFHWETKVDNFTEIKKQYLFIGMAGGYHNL